MGSNSPLGRKKYSKRPDKLKKLEQAYINEKKAIKAKQNKNAAKQGENKGKNFHMKGNRVVI